MTMSKKFAFAAFGGMLAMALSACGDKGTSAGAIDNGCPDGGPCMEYDAEANTLKDLRDKQVYKTVTIGEQTWMAQNMNYKISRHSWCYDDYSGNCEEFGLLYDWAAAMNACPDGWRLPSDDDWYELFENTNGIGKNGKTMKSTSGWDDDGNGEDSFGFTVLPGGDRSSDARYVKKGAYAFLWSASEKDDNYAYAWRYGYDEPHAGHSFDFKTSGLSVRCLMND